MRSAYELDPTNGEWIARKAIAMTRVDYIDLAAALASTRTDPVITPHRMWGCTCADADHANTFTDRIAQNYWARTRDAIADVLAAANPAFDRARFVRVTEKG